MKKTLTALTTAVLMGLSGNVLAAPVSMGSPLLLPFDFGTAISDPGFSSFKFEITTHASDPFDAGDTLIFGIIDDFAGILGPLVSDPIAPGPPDVGPGLYTFDIDTVVFPVTAGLLSIDMASGSLDIQKVVFSIVDPFGDVSAGAVLLEEFSVPAPGALALLGFGLLGLGMRRRAA